jgi:hypothetical protein
MWMTRLQGLQALVSVEAWGASGVHGRPEGYLHIVILSLPFALKATARSHNQSRILLPSCNLRLIAIVIQHK